MALLELKNLKTFFETKRGTVKAVNGVSYSLEAGQVLGVVGESGSGKSVSAMSILRLLDGNGYIDSGEILFDGIDLTKLSMNEMYKIRGNEISVIFQEPMTSLTPVFTVSRQISEPLMIHQGMSKREAAKKAVELGFADGILTDEKKSAADAVSYAFSRRAVTNSLLSKLPHPKNEHLQSVEPLYQRLQLLQH